MKQSLCAYLMDRRDELAHWSGLNWRSGELQVVPTDATPAEKLALRRAVEYGRMMALDDALTEALAGTIRADDTRGMTAAGGHWSRLMWRTAGALAFGALSLAVVQDLSATDAAASARARELAMDWADQGRVSISALSCRRPDDAGNVRCEAHLSNGAAVSLQCRTRWLPVPPRCARDDGQ
jgi:hypothetical protein